MGDGGGGRAARGIRLARALARLRARCARSRRARWALSHCPGPPSPPPSSSPLFTYQRAQIIEGPSTDSIRALRSTLRLPKNTTFDLVFLDHYKPLYTTDLKLLESLELIGPGTTLVADNVLKPGNPPYLAYVRASPTQKARAIEAGRGVLALYPELAENEETGGVKRNMANGYEGQEQAVEEREGERGRPEWVYESRLVRSWDPYTAEEDGIEVSRLVG